MDPCAAWARPVRPSVSCGLLVPVALAAGPDHIGPFTWDDSLVFSCGSYLDVFRLDASGWEAVTVWADEEGNWVRRWTASTLATMF